jgi:hypothetical protein
MTDSFVHERIGLTMTIRYRVASLENSHAAVGERDDFVFVMHGTLGIER